MAEQVDRGRAESCQQGAHVLLCPVTACADSLRGFFPEAVRRLQVLLAQVVASLDWGLSFWCVLCLKVLVSLLLNPQS